MSKAKSILLTIGVSVLALAAIIGAFIGIHAALKPPVQNGFNLEFSVNVPEECELLYSNTESVGGFPSDGTSYYVFDLTKSGAEFSQSYNQGKKEVVENGFLQLFEIVKKATAPKEIPVQYLPSFGEEYCWRLISQTLSVRTEFTGTFESEDAANEFYSGADLLYCVAVPSANRLYVLECTI